MRVLLLLSLLVASLLIWLPKPSAVATEKLACKTASEARTNCQGPKQTITFQEENLPEGKLYTVIIPPGSGFEVRPALSDSLETIESFARKNPKAVAVINAGYFDPNNQKTTSFVTLKGKVVADPKQNERLTGNGNLKPYLEKIFNRSAFQVFNCKNGTWYSIYDPKLHLYLVAKDPKSETTGCTSSASVAAGPLLYSAYSLNPIFADVRHDGANWEDNAKVRWAAQQEGFIDYNASGKLTRDPIGMFSKNARSAVGITQEGAVILMMGSQVPEENKKGFSLPDMAEQMKKHGAVEALNLDGGSSSGLVYRGRAIYGRYEKGKVVKRPVKSVLMVVPVQASK